MCLNKCIEIKYKHCDEFSKIIDNSWGKDLVEDTPWIPNMVLCGKKSIMLMQERMLAIG